MKIDQNAIFKKIIKTLPIFRSILFYWQSSEKPGKKAGGCLERLVAA